MAQVSSIAEVRSFFGLSQELLAAYFDVTRSTLNMAEQRKRYLPTPATQKLTTLIQFANAQPQEPPVETETPTPATGAKNKKLNRLAAECRLTAHNLEQELADAKKQYAQSVQATKLADFLATQPVADERGEEFIALWITVLRNGATKKAERYSPEAQAVLQWKLDWYRYGEMRAKELGGE